MITSWFKTQVIWEKHFFTLTNLGLMKFAGSDLNQPPQLFTIASMTLHVMAKDGVIKLTFKHKHENEEIQLKHMDPVILRTWVREIQEAIQSIKRTPR